MIEYIYDVIKATAGEDIAVNAQITNENGEPITKNCSISIFDGDNKIGKYEGTYNEYWQFIIPAKDTKELKGKYWYVINNANSTVSFKQALYLM